MHKHHSEHRSHAHGHGKHPTAGEVKEAEAESLRLSEAEGHKTKEAEGRKTEAETEAKIETPETPDTPPALARGDDDEILSGLLATQKSAPPRPTARPSRDSVPSSRFRWADRGGTWRG